MLRNFPSPKDVYRIRSPKNFYAAMRADVQLLLENERYLALTTVIMCCLDALAADPGDAGRGKFGSFMERHFPELCTLLDSVCPGRKGTDVLYDKFRNGFAHNRGPKSNFVIVEDHEVEGHWAGGSVPRVRKRTMFQVTVSKDGQHFRAVIGAKCASVIVADDRGNERYGGMSDIISCPPVRLPLLDGPEGPIISVAR